MLSNRVRRIVLALVLMVVPVVTSGCGNLIEEVVGNITSGSGSCPAAGWGGHCDN
jgi:uncharacterized protein YceK